MTINPLEIYFISLVDKIDALSQAIIFYQAKIIIHLNQLVQQFHFAQVHQFLTKLKKY